VIQRSARQRRRYRPPACHAATATHARRRRLSATKTFQREKASDALPYGTMPIVCSFSPPEMKADYPPICGGVQSARRRRRHARREGCSHTPAGRRKRLSTVCRQSYSTIKRPIAGVLLCASGLRAVEPAFVAGVIRATATPPSQRREEEVIRQAKPAQSGGSARSHVVAISPRPRPARWQARSFARYSFPEASAVGAASSASNIVPAQPRWRLVRYVFKPHTQCEFAQHPGCAASRFDYSAPLKRPAILHDGAGSGKREDKSATQRPARRHACSPCRSPPRPFCQTVRP